MMWSHKFGPVYRKYSIVHEEHPDMKLYDLKETCRPTERSCLNKTSMVNSY